jgi:hypothetical protein
MTTYDFVHLVIHAAGDRIEGRTNLQATVYFVGVLTDRVQSLGYRSHYYGTFSPAVAGAVQELRGLRFLEQRVSASDASDDRGFEMTRYDYILTAEGRQVAEAKVASWPAEWEGIRAAVRRLKESEVQDYVPLAIAAKTDLIKRQAGTALEAAALKEKAAEHGWKAFTDTQFAEAIRFLQTVVSSTPQPKPAGA